MEVIYSHSHFSWLQLNLNRINVHIITTVSMKNEPLHGGTYMIKLSLSVEMHAVALLMKLAVINAIEAGDQSKSSGQELRAFTIYYLEARNEAGTDLEVIGEQELIEHWRSLMQ